ncbi:MAG: hypothetical protein MJZ25_08820 [Fibrobacter sp.]|nr:hypothetical protein [Fibrobacter sp.]
MIPAPYYITFPCAKNATRQPLPMNFLNKFFKNRLDIGLAENMFYDGYELNQHHIKTKVYWDVIIPQIFDFVDMHFSPDEYKLIPYYDESGQFDLSYHNPISSGKFTWYDIDFKRHTGDFSTLRDIANKKSITRYHSLSSASHSCAYIVNHNFKYDLNVLLLCDSMFIPIIPILANCCHRLTVCDNRRHTRWFCKTPPLTYDRFIVSRILCDFTPRDIAYRFL